MKEQLIEFETAKLAKEKGYKFNQKDNSVSKNVIDIIPTQSLLQKWLREKHDIIVEVRKGVIHKWYFLVFDKNDPIVIEDSFEYTYEQALEKGLIEALKLIKS